MERRDSLTNTLAHNQHINIFRGWTGRRWLAHSGAVSWIKGRIESEKLCISVLWRWLHSYHIYLYPYGIFIWTWNGYGYVGYENPPSNASTSMCGANWCKVNCKIYANAGDWVAGSSEMMIMYYWIGVFRYICLCHSIWLLRMRKDREIRRRVRPCVGPSLSPGVYSNICGPGFFRCQMMMMVVWLRLGPSDAFRWWKERNPLGRGGWVARSDGCGIAMRKMEVRWNLFTIREPQRTTHEYTRAHLDRYVCRWRVGRMEGRRKEEPYCVPCFAHIHHLPYTFNSFRNENDWIPKMILKAKCVRIFWIKF